jgi:hypothetical protein
MSSISSMTSYQTTRLSPLEKLQQELASEVSAGTVSSSDQDALSTALKDIDSTLKSQMSSNGTAGTAPPSPSEMQSKISGLIDGEVSSGKLTSSQADELKNVFSSAFAKGGPGGAGGGPGGAPPSGGDSDGDSSATSSTDSDVQKLLQDFLKLLQDSTSSSAGYDSSGSKSSGVTGALLLDYQG